MKNFIDNNTGRWLTIYNELDKLFMIRQKGRPIPPKYHPAIYALHSFLEQTTFQEQEDLYSLYIVYDIRPFAEMLLNIAGVIGLSTAPYDTTLSGVYDKRLTSALREYSERKNMYSILKDSAQHVAAKALAQDTQWTYTYPKFRYLLESPETAALLLYGISQNPRIDNGKYTVYSGDTPCTLEDIRMNEREDSSISAALNKLSEKMDWDEWIKNPCLPEFIPYLVRCVEENPITRIDYIAYTDNGYSICMSFAFGKEFGFSNDLCCGILVCANKEEETDETGYQSEIISSGIERSQLLLMYKFMANKLIDENSMNRIWGRWDVSI